MTVQHHSSGPPLRPGPNAPGEGQAGRARKVSPLLPPPAPEIDWAAWNRAIERKRRALSRRPVPRRQLYPLEHFIDVTCASFRLDGLQADPTEVAAALARGPSRRPFRSRQAQRLRNHVAILRAIERRLARRQPLGADTIIRWYTSISCGLSTTALDTTATARLDEVARRINASHTRLQAAVQDIARLHLQLLTRPLVPSFNGILARLLLTYHLGQRLLPAVVFDADSDAPRLRDERMLLARLIDLIGQSYDRLLRRDR